MKLTDRIKNIFRRESSALTPMTVEEYVSLLKARSSENALRVATVYRCVRLLSDSVGQLPLVYKRKDGPIFRPVESGDIADLIGVQPNDTQTPFDFMSQAVTDVLLSGNAYVFPHYYRGRLFRLALCLPNCVQHDLDKDTYTVNDTLNGVCGTFAESEIIHIKGFGGNPKTGQSVLAYARSCLETSMAGSDEIYDRIINGGAVRGLISNLDTLAGFGRNQTDRLDAGAAALDARFRAGRRIQSVPGDMKFTQLSQSNADMQFLETMKFGVRDICRFFGVHPSFVFDDTSNNYKSAEMANVAFLSNTLNPLLTRIEAEFTRKLVPRAMWGQSKFEFDRRALYACDLESKIKYQTQRIQAGVSTINDERILEDNYPVKGGNTILVSANLKTLDEMVAAGGNTTEE